MQRLISFLLLLLPAVLGTTDYDGMFKLVKATSPEEPNVVIPGDFHIVLRTETETRYAISLRVGNSLRGEMSVTEGAAGTHDAVHIGPLSSTMMMPPENIFKLEQFLTSNLPKMTGIYLTGEGELVMEHGEATVTFQKEE